MTDDWKRMPYAFLQDVAATWEQYERVAALLVDPVPTDLILHVAGPTETGFRTIEVWESEEAWQRFRTDRLEPTVAGLTRPFRPQATFRDLRATHVLAGPGCRRAIDHTRSLSGS